MRSRRYAAFIALVLSLGLLLGITQSAGAQEEALVMSELYYSIWPEYDTPDVLVIYSGIFVNNTDKPFAGEIRYNIPKGARINMVCETEQGMLCQPYDTQEVDGYVQVIWSPSHPINPGQEFPVMFEYNMGSFTGAGVRDFQADFKTTYEVKNLSVEVKEPKRATGFSMSPEPRSSRKDNDGFTNHYLSYDNMAAGEAIAFAVSYERPDAAPSVQDGSGSAQPGASSSSSGQAGALNSTVVILLSVFIILLVVVLLLAMRNNQRQAVVQSAAQRKKASSKGRPGQARAPQKSPGSGSSAKMQRQEEKRKLRKMLLDGKISEGTYKELVKELEED